METQTGAPEQERPMYVELHGDVGDLCQAVDRLDALIHWMQNGDAPRVESKCEGREKCPSLSVVEVLTTTPGVIREQTSRITEFAAKIKQLLS